MQQTWPSQVQLHTQPHATSLHQALVDLVALRDQVAWSIPQSPFWTELCVTEGESLSYFRSFLETLRDLFGSHFRVCSDNCFFLNPLAVFPKASSPSSRIVRDTF